jgi:hypothetical protein
MRLEGEVSEASRFASFVLQIKNICRHCSRYSATPWPPRPPCEPFLPSSSPFAVHRSPFGVRSLGVWGSKVRSLEFGVRSSEFGLHFSRTSCQCEEANRVPSSNIVFSHSLPTVSSVRTFPALIVAVRDSPFTVRRSEFGVWGLGFEVRSLEFGASLFTNVLPVRGGKARTLPLL